MKIHIIRHAEAIDRGPALPDEYRSLTCRGRNRFRRVAETLKKNGIDPEIIVTSPLVRAVQTADILAEALRFAGELTLYPPLAGSFDLPHLREYLDSIAPVRELVLVGHEPDLGMIVGELLDQSPCSLKKGAVVTLKITSQGNGIAATFLSLVTGGGKLITNLDAAMGRLTGDHAQAGDASDT